MFEKYISEMAIAVKEYINNCKLNSIAFNFHFFLARKMLFVL